MLIRNPVYTSHGRIDCEIDHPVYGWIPFTADPNDVEEHGRLIHAAALEMGPAPYVEPPAPPVPVPNLTFAQLLFGLVTESWITEAEGTAWLVNRTLPAPVEALISSQPANQQLLVRARALQPTEILRADPMVQAMGAAQGKTSEELDQFFRTYAGV